ncbi:MAG: hypothetical protein IRY99_17250, partial [Isosphaeraceae bacterium]|nr:hypothetical protein [Isosphaeraceae bacterium]
GSTAPTEQTRRGVRDAVDDPLKLVAVELLLLRYAIDDPLEFLMRPAEDRNLSCCLNLTWPVRQPILPDPDSPLGRDVLQRLIRAFAPLPRKTRAIASRSHAEGPRFSGWLSYPTATQTGEAFKIVREALHAQGLGVEQTTRELFLPREWS